MVVKSVILQAPTEILQTSRSIFRSIQRYQWRPEAKLNKKENESFVFHLEMTDVD
jgi:hypothetical protein